METRKVLLRSLNPYITCYVCKVCKTCLLNHLSTNVTCPKCEIVIHQSHPTNYIMPDRSLQDIVYKLVPNLFRNEMERREAFHKKHGLPFDNPLNISKMIFYTQNQMRMHLAVVRTKIITASMNIKVLFGITLQVTVWLRPDHTMEPIKCPFICCSWQTTVAHLKKLLAKTIYGDLARFKDFDILCNHEIMGKDHSMKFIYRTRWRNMRPPLELFSVKELGIIACHTPWGRWWQTLEEVFVEFELQKPVKGKQLFGEITKKTVRFEINGEPLLKGELFNIVHENESTWTVEKNLLCIMLSKAKADSSNCWRSLFADGDFKADEETFDYMERKLVLEKFQKENPGMDFTGSEITGNYHNGGPQLPD
ncbi:NudC domain-containing protein 2 [Trichinella murrelli]|uniref:NudC domain-containing protein 2 n=1 Tax=Trichinella murrelli TaxID=144512 RepID=A0A0V0TSF3_9BILA|nr:NudC domain-containing protein 2 [Trichinella murrelli]